MNNEKKSATQRRPGGRNEMVKVKHQPEVATRAPQLRSNALLSYLFSKKIHPYKQTSSLVVSVRGCLRGCLRACVHTCVLVCMRV